MGKSSFDLQEFRVDQGELKPVFDLSENFYEHSFSFVGELTDRRRLCYGEIKVPGKTFFHPRPLLHLKFMGFRKTGCENYFIQVAGYEKEGTRKRIENAISEEFELAGGLNYKDVRLTKASDPQGFFHTFLIWNPGPTQSSTVTEQVPASSNQPPESN